MIARGDLYYADLDPTVGHEMQKTRPALVMSNNTINERAAVIVVCPITGAAGKSGRYHIFIPEGTGGLNKDSIIHCGQIRAIDKERLGQRIGSIDSQTMALVEEGIKIVLSL